jgi:hypothetical protein
MVNTIASPAVWIALLKCHGKQVYQQMQYTFNILSSISQAGATVRWIWEGWSHRRMAEGGGFTLLPMTEEGDYLVRDDSGGLTIPFTRMTIKIFSPHELNSTTLDPSTYYIPFASNNAMFDSFCRSAVIGVGDGDGDGVGMQMTIQKVTHSKPRASVCCTVGCTVQRHGILSSSFRQDVSL